MLYCILNTIRNLRVRGESVDYQNSKYTLEILKNITDAKSLIIKKYKLLFKYKYKDFKNKLSVYYEYNSIGIVPNEYHFIKKLI